MASVAHQDGCVRERRGGEGDQGARPEPIESSAHLASALQPFFDTGARAKTFLHGSEDGSRGGLLAQVAVGPDSQLSHALQQVFLPRKDDHGHVPKQQVALQRAAEPEAVELGHQDVGDDQIGIEPESDLERPLPVPGFPYDAPVSTEQSAEEPCDGGVVVDDEDAAILEQELHVGVVLAFALSAGLVLGHDVEPRGDGDGADGACMGEADGAFTSDREHFADASDGTPDGGEDFGALSEVDGDAPGLRAHGVEEAGFDLLCEAFRELFDGQLAQEVGGFLGSGISSSRSHGLLELGGGDRLGQGARHAVGEKRSGLVGQGEGTDDDDGGRLGDGVLCESLAQAHGARQVTVEDDDVGGERTGELEGLGEVVGSLDLERARCVFGADAEGIREGRASDDEDGEGLFGW